MASKTPMNGEQTHTTDSAGVSALGVGDHLDGGLPSVSRSEALKVTIPSDIHPEDAEHGEHTPSAPEEADLLTLAPTTAPTGGFFNTYTNNEKVSRDGLYFAPQYQQSPSSIRTDRTDTPTIVYVDDEAVSDEAVNDKDVGIEHLAKDPLKVSCTGADEHISGNGVDMTPHTPTSLRGPLSSSKVKVTLATEPATEDTPEHLKMIISSWDKFYDTVEKLQQSGTFYANLKKTGPQAREFLTILESVTNSLRLNRTYFGMDHQYPTTDHHIVTQIIAKLEDVLVEYKEGSMEMVVGYACLQYIASQLKFIEFHQLIELGNITPSHCNPDKCKEDYEKVYNTKPFCLHLPALRTGLMIWQHAPFPANIVENEITSIQSHKEDLRMPEKKLVRNSRKVKGLQPLFCGVVNLLIPFLSPLAIAGIIVPQKAKLRQDLMSEDQSYELKFVLRRVVWEGASWQDHTESEDSMKTCVEMPIPSKIGRLFTFADGDMIEKYVETQYGVRTAINKTKDGRLEFEVENVEDHHSECTLGRLLAAMSSYASGVRERKEARELNEEKMKQDEANLAVQVNGLALNSDTNEERLDSLMDVERGEVVTDPRRMEEEDSDKENAAN